MPSPLSRAVRVSHSYLSSPSFPIPNRIFIYATCSHNPHPHLFWPILHWFPITFILPIFLAISSLFTLSQHVQIISIHSISFFSAIYLPIDLGWHYVVKTTLIVFNLILEYSISVWKMYVPNKSKNKIKKYNKHRKKKIYDNHVVTLLFILVLESFTRKLFIW